MDMRIPSERKIAKELRDDYKTLSEFEALQIAVGIRQNSLFERAHALTSDDRLPSALEAIAIQLGMGADGKDTTESVVDAIHGIVELLEERLPENLDVLSETLNAYVKDLN